MVEAEERLSTVETRLNDLEKQLAKLTAENRGALEAAQQATQRTLGTMRVELRCPACEGRRILHAREIVDRTDSAKQQLAVTATGFWATKPVGKFECYICARCGHTEWHVPHPEEIAIDGDKIALLEAEAPSKGPYR